jgi:hypothetical protein
LLSRTGWHLKYSAIVKHFVKKAHIFQACPGYPVVRSQNQYPNVIKQKENAMTTHIHKTHMKPHHTIVDHWIWLVVGIVLIIAALVVFDNLGNRATSSTNTIPPVHVQSVPDAASQGVAGYILAHSDPYAQSVPDASAQGLENYLRAHSMPYAQTVPDPAVQSALDYLRLHAVNESLITDPAAQSVMDYLKAHGIQP